MCFFRVLIGLIQSVPAHNYYNIYISKIISFFLPLTEIYTVIVHVELRITFRSNYVVSDWSVRLRKERISRSCVRCPWILPNLIDCRTGWWRHGCKWICWIRHGCCKIIYVCSFVSIKYRSHKSSSFKRPLIHRHSGFVINILNKNENYSTK